MRCAQGVSAAAALGLAGEDLAAARRVAGARRVVWPVDHEPGDAALERDFAEIELVDAGARLRVDERGGDPLRARGDAQPDMSPRVEVDRRAVEREVHGRAVAPHETTGRIVPAGGRQHRLNGDLVFGVEREIVLDREPAARAERQSLDVPPLRGSVFRRVASLDVAHRAIADRAAADLHRGLRVAFEQCRRHAERRRDVVEARDGYVLR